MKIWNQCGKNRVQTENILPKIIFLVLVSLFNWLLDSLYCNETVRFSYLNEILSTRTFTLSNTKPPTENTIQAKKTGINNWDIYTRASPSWSVSRDANRILSFTFN